MLLISDDSICRYVFDGKPPQLKSGEVGLLVMIPIDSEIINCQPSFDSLRSALNVVLLLKLSSLKLRRPVCY